MNPKLGIDRPVRVGFRMPAGLVERAKRVADSQGESLTALVERALQRELDRLEGKRPES
jgi:predicted HicB family RNase H-like nuclease